MGWWTECQENMKKHHPDAQYCGHSHCDSTNVKNYADDFCYCKGDYCPSCLDGCTDNDTKCSGGCPFHAGTPIPDFSNDCFCCCSCLASDTPVACSESESKAIMEFRVGDPVWVADDVDLRSWSQREVRFSQGTGPGGLNVMIKVSFGDPEDHEYLLTGRHQLFLMPDGKLKVAARLVPGVDSLVRPDGSPAPVNALEVGQFKKGLHHIATTTQPATRPGGHLIVAGGIVAGDYALQTAAIDREAVVPHLTDDHDDLPEFGTPEYAERHAHLDATHHEAKLPDVPAAAHDHEVFQPSAARRPVAIPDHARYFLNHAQAELIQARTPPLPASSQVGDQMVSYLFRRFGAFHPKVHFYYDVDNQLPNAYSFKEYDVSFVVVNGGLARTDAISVEAMQIIIGHELGHLFGGDPQDAHGLACQGRADYLAVKVMVPSIYLGLEARPVLIAGIDQIQKFFEPLIDEGHLGGGDCNDLGIDCRLQSMVAGFRMQSLPHCAGGPPDPALEVESAAGIGDERGGVVTITFNLPVDRETASELGNYAFEPRVEVTGIELLSRSRVALHGEFAAGQEYEVLVTGVESFEHQPLEPGKNHATFEIRGDH